MGEFSSKYLNEWPSRYRMKTAEETFDQIVESYEHSQHTDVQRFDPTVPRVRYTRLTSIPVDDARRLFASYVSHWERTACAVQDMLTDHLRICTSAPGYMLQARNDIFRSGFRKGFIIHGDRRSGKTSALLDGACQIAEECQCRVALVSPHKQSLLDEMARRRIFQDQSHRYRDIRLFGEKEIDDVRGYSSDLFVDDWFNLSPGAQIKLSQLQVVGAVGTYPQYTPIPVRSAVETANAFRNDGERYL